MNVLQKRNCIATCPRCSNPQPSSLSGLVFCSSTGSCICQSFMSLMMLLSCSLVVCVKPTGLSNEGHDQSHLFATSQAANRAHL